MNEGASFRTLPDSRSDVPGGRFPRPAVCCRVATKTPRSTTGSFAALSRRGMRSKRSSLLWKQRRKVYGRGLATRR